MSQAIRWPTIKGPSFNNGLFPAASLLLGYPLASPQLPMLVVSHKAQTFLGFGLLLSIFGIPSEAIGRIVYFKYTIRTRN